MSIFSKFFNSIRNWFDGIPDKIRVYTSKSLQVTTLIKGLLTGQAAATMADIIPGDWDNDIREKFIKHLETAIPYLQIVDICKDAPNKIECWISELRKQPRHMQDALLAKLASLLTAMQDDKQLKQTLYDSYTQIAYSSQKNH